MVSTMACPVDSAAGVLVAAGALGAPAFPVGASSPHPIRPTTAPAATIIASQYPRLFIVTSSEKAACPFFLFRTTSVVQMLTAMPSDRGAAIVSRYNKVNPSSSIRVQWGQAGP